MFRGAKLLIDESEIDYVGIESASNADENGIWINTDGAVIRFTQIHHPRIGILLINSSNSEILCCDIEYCDWFGIYVENSDNNKLDNNTVRYAVYGIQLCTSADNNTVIRNYIRDCDYGLIIWHSDNNLVRMNSILYNNLDGIYICASNNNMIHDNFVHDNGRDGVVLENASDNAIYSNIIADNGHLGIYLSSSGGNKIFFNSIYGDVEGWNCANWTTNTEVQYTYNNKVYLHIMGNYWSDYNGTDNDGDGIGDTPYSSDTAPLILPICNYMIGDRDNDGLDDILENIYDTNPASNDTDGDGLDDKSEIYIYNTDPTNNDTDGDGFNDGFEVEHGTDPLDPQDHPEEEVPEEEVSETVETTTTTQEAYTSSTKTLRVSNIYLIILGVGAISTLGVAILFLRKSRRTYL